MEHNSILLEFINDGTVIIIKKPIKYLRIIAR
jgi:hypothetical protein